RNMTQPNGVAAVDRALLILEAFLKGSEDRLTLHELANRTGLYKSTILRLCDTLQRGRFLVRLDDGRFRLGAALFRLGMRYKAGFSLDDHVLPVMSNVARATEESV